MTEWQEGFESHPIRTRIQELGDFLDAYEVPEQHQDWGAPWVPHLQYLVGRLSELLESTDPELALKSNLDAADAQVSAILTQIQGLPTAPDPAANMTQIRLSAESLAQSIATWPAFRQTTTAQGQKELSALRREIERSKSDLSKIKAQADKERTAIQASLSDVSQSIEAAKAKLTASQAALQTDIATRQSELANTIEAQKARLDQAIAEFQSQFSASQNASATEAEAARKEQAELNATERTSQRDAFDALIANSKTQFDTHLAERTTSAESIIAQLEQLRQAAQRTTEAIGMAGMAGGYKNDADQQKENADNMRIVALVALVGAAVAAFVALTTSHTNGQLDYKSFFAKLVVSAAIGSIAAYAIVQSAHHRERERQDRKLQIELASIDSYLAQMNEEQQNTIKATLAEAWFGKPIQPLPKSDAEAGVVLTGPQLIKIIENMGKS